MNWSPSIVRTACRMTSDQVLMTEQSTGAGLGLHPSNRRTWATIQTVQRLAWQYGDEHAAEIMSQRDRATRDDLNAWNRLGRRAAA